MIGVAALLQLADWLQARRQRNQSGGASCVNLAKYAEKAKGDEKLTKALKGYAFQANLDVNEEKNLFEQAENDGLLETDDYRRTFEAAQQARAVISVLPYVNKQ